MFIPADIRSEMSIWERASFIYLKTRSSLIVLAHAIQDKIKHENQEISYDINDKFDEINLRKLVSIFQEYFILELFCI